MPKNFNYINQQTPQSYQCSSCGASKCKLWRQYQTFLDHINLMCADCASRNQKVDFEIAEDGSHKNKKGVFDFRIGQLVPAVPTEENDTFWGYLTIPELGFVWWKNLPLR